MDARVDPDLYDVAVLAGGLPRAVDTALVALVCAGRVRVVTPGELATVDPTRRHPVEAAVLDAVGTHGHRCVDVVQWRVAGDERLLEVSRRLTAEGLLRRWPAGAPTRAGRRLLAALAATAPTGGERRVVWEVALGGREAMTDSALRAAVFERFPAPGEPTGEGLRRRFAFVHRIPDPAHRRPDGVGWDESEWFAS